jgi:NitT/TauT family transport system permease protein
VTSDSAVDTAGDWAAAARRPNTIPARGGWLRGATLLALQRIAAYLLVMAVGALLWQTVIWGFGVPAYLLPSPLAAGHALIDQRSAIGHACALTVQATVVGMLVATAVAIALALLLMASRLLDAAFMPLIVAVRTVPMIAIAPVLILLFGRDRWSGIGMVALLCFFQIMLATRAGFDAPSRHMLELMHCAGAGFWQTLLKLRIPCALTHVFTGLRIASASAVLCAMFAEWLSGAPGLGSLILDANSKQDFVLMWAAVAVGTTMSYLFFTFTIALERAVHDWSR